MPHYLHLFEGTTRFNVPTGTIVQDIDLANSTGTSKYNLFGYQKDPPDFKKVYADSPQIDGIRLVAYRLKAFNLNLKLDLVGTTTDDVLKLLSALQSFLLKAMDAQVARQNGGTANYFWIAERPNNDSTKTYKNEIIEGEVKEPDTFLGPNLLGHIIEAAEMRLLLDPITTASILTILNAVAANNGDADFVDISDTGATAVTGELPAPLSVKVKGGDTNTNRVMMALRTRGTPSNFKQIYWGKDATLTGGTVARNADATFDGNNTTNGTRTTAVGTTETKTHRQVNNTNVADQYGDFRVFGRFRSSAAGVYSVRVKQFFYDGTNDSPTVQWSADTPVVVGTDSGNNLALVDMGYLHVGNPGNATAYGIVYELWVTCSNIAGTPTLDCDMQLLLMPLGEGPEHSGFAQVTFDFGTGATAVDNAVISGIPADEQAYLANSSDVVTFSKMIEAGGPLYALPNDLARLYILLIDATNSRHNHTFVTAVTVKHELRHANVIGA